MSVPATHLLPITNPNGMARSADKVRLNASPATIIRLRISQYPQIFNLRQLEAALLAKQPSPATASPPKAPASNK
jgi:hypothetical protein